MRQETQGAAVLVLAPLAEGAVPPVPLPAHLPTTGAHHTRRGAGGAWLMVVVGVGVGGVGVGGGGGRRTLPERHHRQVLRVGPPAESVGGLAGSVLVVVGQHRRPRIACGHLAHLGRVGEVVYDTLA